MTKIEALRKTIYNLENDVLEYDWSDCNRCNCGVLARTLLNGKSVYDAGLAKAKIGGIGGAFSTRGVCITAGIELPEVFMVLSDAGFSHLDLVELEYLGNLRILDRLNMTASYDTDMKCFKVNEMWNNKNLLIRYLKAWVEILEEQQSKEPEANECDATVDAKTSEAGYQEFSPIKFEKIKELIPQLSNS